MQVNNTSAMSTFLAFASCFPASHSSPAYASAPIAVYVYNHQSSVFAARLLINEWIKDTAFHSSPSLILRSNCLEKARKLRGRDLLGDLLQIIDAHPYHVLTALSDLVEPPFGEELAGDLYGQIRAWKDWAGEHDANGNTEEVSESGLYGMESD